MSGLVIECPCGHVVEAPGEQALLDAARAHVAASHPDLAGRLLDEDLLRMAMREHSRPG
jgi:hypothetical protein